MQIFSTNLQENSHVILEFLVVETRWVHMDFTKKQNKNVEIVRYKAQFVAQGFSQNLILIYEETYSLVLDTTIF